MKDKYIYFLPVFLCVALLVSIALAWISYLSKPTKLVTIPEDLILKEPLDTSITWEEFDGNLRIRGDTHPPPPTCTPGDFYAEFDEAHPTFPPRLYACVKTESIKEIPE
jgi:hypothetical protein